MGEEAAEAAPGPDLGPEEHTIKVFLSGNSGNKEMVTHQQRIFMIFNSLKIPYTAVDIAAPGHEDETDFMRANAKKKDGQRHVLPPQIFNAEKYCGDYDDFDLANEDDVLEEFLLMPRKVPKAAPVATDALPAETEKPEVGKMENGEATNGEAKSEEVPMETEDKIAEQTPQESSELDETSLDPASVKENDEDGQHEGDENEDDDHEGELVDQDNVTEEEVKEDNIDSVDSSQLVDEECGRSECT